MCGAGFDPLRRRLLPGLLEPWHAHPDCHGPLRVGECGGLADRLRHERERARAELVHHVELGGASGVDPAEKVRSTLEVDLVVAPGVARPERWRE